MKLRFQIRDFWIFCVQALIKLFVFFVFNFNVNCIFMTRFFKFAISWFCCFFSIKKTFISKIDFVSLFFSSSLLSRKNWRSFVKIFMKFYYFDNFLFNCARWFFEYCKVVDVIINWICFVIKFVSKCDFINSIWLKLIWSLRHYLWNSLMKTRFY